MDQERLTPLVKALSLRDDISDQERSTILGLAYRPRTFSRGETIVKDHSAPNDSCLILDGYAARAAVMSDGKRQLTAVHVAGDFVDLHALMLRVMDHSVVALSDCHVAFIPHRQLIKITEEQPHLGRLFWLSTVVDAAIHRAWLLCIGRKSPAQHVAHLICELDIRLRAIGAASKDSFPFPITQSELSDMLGLSLVHVNKTLSRLREMGDFTWDGTTVRIVNRDRLVEFSEFDPTYLSLIKTPR